MRYRLVKPEWAKPTHNGKDNPHFVKEIDGPDIVEGEFKESYLKKMNELGYGVYYFPNHNSQPKKGYLSGSDVDVFNCIFVDMDLKDGVYKDKEDFVGVLYEFEVQPNIIVDSGNGIHAYWYISDLDREKYVELQLRLIQQFKTDSSIYTVMQLMRCPGYYNTKRHDQWIESVRYDLNKEPYQLKDLDNALPIITQESVQKMNRHLNKLSGVESMPEMDELDLDELPEKFLALIESSNRIRKLFEDDAPGRRSENDMSLANILFNKEFSKKEALQVLLNTPKARSKGPYRKDYALGTVDKVYKDRVTYVVGSVDEVKRLGPTSRGDIAQEVRGPRYLDCLAKPWRKTQVCGIIAGTGVGKTALTLAMFKEMILNNPDNDDIFIFFTLEMPQWEIIERWTALTEGMDGLDNRLYVVANEDDNGDPRHINLQQIYWFSKEISKSTGKKIGAIAIDHIGIIDNSIDVSKKPTFGLKGDDVGFGTQRTIAFETICAKMKELAKSLDCFLVIQSQTTKEKAGNGDVPLEVGAAYGTAKFEWYVDYIITLWQPLRRVEDKTDLRVLAWQYCKVRSKSSKDPIKLNDPRLLNVDIDSGELRPLNAEEVEEFTALEQEATALRKKAAKKEGIEYKNSIDIKRLRALIKRA